MAIYKTNSFKDAGKKIQSLIVRKKANFMAGTWNDLVKVTPVRTGTARYSWTFSPGRPSTRKPPVRKYGMPAAPDPKSYQRNWTNWYITNNQDYVPLLNAGSSKKAPQMFIQKAVRVNIRKFNKGAY